MKVDLAVLVLASNFFGKKKKTKKPELLVVPYLKSFQFLPLSLNIHSDAAPSVN